jgi:predicted nucleic acid-binding protein
MIGEVGLRGEIGLCLVDSSVWIDYFNGQITPQTATLERLLGLELLLVGDIILGEVLQGFRSDADFEQARLVLARFELVSLLSPALAVRSAQNFRTLRKLGVTVRKTVDCFIATYCIETGCALLHADRDFDPFERYLGLQVWADT